MTKKPDDDDDWMNDEWREQKKNRNVFSKWNSKMMI